MSSDICNKWFQNKLVNPITGRAIKSSGKVYQDLLKKCSQIQLNEEDEKFNVKRDPLELRLIKTLLTRLHECLNYLMDPEIDPLTGDKIKSLRQNILEVQSNEIQENFDAQKKLTFSRYNDKIKVMTTVVTTKTICKDVINEFKQISQNNYLGSLDKISTHVIVTPIKSENKLQYGIGTLTNYLINAQVCPNYQYSYSERTCKECSSLNLPSDSHCAFIFKESYDLTLKDLFSNQQQCNVELSILGQLIMAVHYLNHNIGVLHDNLLSDDIYIKKTPELQSKYMSYMVPGLGMFLIENHGYMVVLGNFNNVKIVDDSMMKFRNESDKYKLYPAFIKDNVNIFRMFHGGEHSNGTHQPLKISASLKSILYQFDKDPSIKLDLLKPHKDKIIGATILLKIIKFVYMSGDFDMIKTLVFHPVK